MIIATVGKEITIETLHPSKIQKYDIDEAEHKFFDCGGIECTTPDLSVIPLPKFIVNLKFNTSPSDPPNKWCNLPMNCIFCQKLYDDGKITVMGTTEKFSGRMWQFICCNNRSIHRQCLQLRRNVHSLQHK